MIRNETRTPDGAIILAEIIDLAAGTITIEEHGVVTQVRDLTADEIAAYAPPVDTAPASAVDPAQLVALIDGATSLAKARDAMRAIVAAITPTAITP